MEQLAVAAVKARTRAYAPYSGYRVGAAVLTRSGKVYLGCNVENASYGASLCAERTAIARMVADGEREPVACAVATGGKSPGTPCGICRQVLAEFADDMPIMLILVGDRPDRKSVRRETTLAKLLPDAFRLKRR